MGRFSVCLTLVLACGAGTASVAQGSDQEQPPRQRVDQVRSRAREAIVKRLDKNADGSIVREEWVRDARLFERLDRNKDGVLNGAELAPLGRRVLRAQRVRVLRTRLQMRRLDVNKDGRITPEEWKGPAARFQALDRNKDGAIGPSELRRRRPATKQSFVR
jgi:Ca2+-binding EF-hand superfamily protein